jgi:hypothetical protein
MEQENECANWPCKVIDMPDTYSSLVAIKPLSLRTTCHTVVLKLLPPVSGTIYTGNI